MTRLNIGHLAKLQELQGLMSMKNALSHRVIHGFCGHGGDKFLWP